ncbi:MAG: cell wall-binding repeat-containing protein [Aeromicrobium sp.]|nr:cell wall-binding repeat-containing protein [Aeromicrobium sp.]
MIAGRSGSKACRRVTAVLSVTLAVCLWAGAGTATASGLTGADGAPAVLSLGPGDDIPTSGPAPEWRLEGTLGPDGSQHVFSVELAEGDFLAVDLYEAFPGIEVRLFQPHVTTVHGPDRPRVVSRSAGGERLKLLYQCPPGGAGTYYYALVNTSGRTGSYWGDWGHQRYLTGEWIERAAGKDRYETSYELSRRSFYASDAAVLVSGTEFPDALSASALAGHLACPILLAPPVTNRQSVEALVGELRGLGVERLYVVGGAAAVSGELVATVARRLGVEATRVAGSDRYGTAIAVARQLEALSGTTPDRAFLVSGAEFADGMSVGPYAYVTGAPVLLTRPAALPGDLSSYLSARPGIALDIVGGAAAVSSDLEAGIRRTRPAGCMRIAGGDRYQTAVALAAEMVDRRAVGSWHRVGVASGLSFADALSGAPACGVWGSPMLLTKTASLPRPTADMIRARRGPIYSVVVMGGPAAVSDEVVYDRIAQALWY